MVDNVITNTIVAGVTGGSSVDAGGAVSITAVDDATISSDVVAASASIAAGDIAVSLAIAVSVANNTIDNSVRGP